jgi:RNA polymerase sigma-70 factor (ECF subfamily)
LTAYPDHTDHQLFTLISEGDEKAFAQLFYKYTAYLQPYVTGLLKSESAAEEIIQQSFLRIWLNRDKLPGIENPKAWIFRVAANECHNFLRHKEVEQRMYNEVSYREELRQKHTVDPVSLSEIKAAIQDAIEQLPQQRKTIYKLNREQGLKIAEISERLNLSTQTVKNTLGAAIESIRQYLLKKGFDHGSILVLILCTRFH